MQEQKTSTIEPSMNYTNDNDNYWNGKRNLKLRDFVPRQRQDSDSECNDSLDLEFSYSDTDTHANEIAELYTYTELSEFQLNVRAFEHLMDYMNCKPSWHLLNASQKKTAVYTLLDRLDSADRSVRMRSARCFLYLVQGCWDECQSDREQHEYAKENIMLLYEFGVFNSFTELLMMEIASVDAMAVAIQRKVSVNIADSTDIRVILSVMYTFVEVMRTINDVDKLEYLKLRENFHEEISNCTHDESLLVKLFGMVTRFCSGTAPHYPIKKVLLLIWKLILFSLGDWTVMKRIKLNKREESGLEKFEEDTVDIVRHMRASSPPAGISEGFEGQNQRRANRAPRRSLMKQSSLDDESMECEPTTADDDEFEEQRTTESTNELVEKAPSIEVPQVVQAKGLPWAPKIRQKDLDVFLNNIRMKFFRYSLPNDCDTIIFLPPPIQEGIKVLKRYVYVSLAEVQIKKEELITKYPLSNVEEIPENPTETLYQAMLPTMQQNVIALLKILLAAAPTSKAKTDSINILADVLPEEMPMTVLQSMKLGIDVNRHKEIIVKAISGILLILLKHFKLNHIYQFEYLSQYLVFANCIPLVLKFFNQNITTYVSAKNVIPILDFPSCVIGDQPELTSESLEIGDNQQCCWRNVFTCINLLRVLNKVTKWKHSRIMMLVVFKSSPILRKTLKVRHAMMQLYVLKLLKMQTKYLGRQWRKSNMKTMSAIYQKVRHRLTDDWAYGNEIEARPWDFQAEECLLRAAVDKFNNRRYLSSRVDNIDDVSSVLASHIEFSEDFRKHYHVWLRKEVFNKSIDWDELSRVWV